MNRREHALLTRQLVAKCGGLEESARHCRLSRSSLARCGDPDDPSHLPADVVNELELYCGEPTYSQAMADDRPSREVAEDLAAEACETVEEAALLERLVRLSSAKGELTPRQRKEIAKGALQLQELLARIVATAVGGD